MAPFRLSTKNLTPSAHHPGISSAVLPCRVSTNPPGELRNTNKMHQCTPSNISEDNSALLGVPFSSQTADSADRAELLVYLAVDEGPDLAWPSSGAQLSRSWQPRPNALTRCTSDSIPEKQRRYAPTTRPSDDGVLWVHGHLLLLATRVGHLALVRAGAPWYLRAAQARLASGMRNGWRP
jgi:hypothetical protein